LPARRHTPAVNLLSQHKKVLLALLNKALKLYTFLTLNGIDHAPVFVLLTTGDQSMSIISGMGEPAQKPQDMQKQTQVNFDAADTNQDGVVSATEFMQMLSTEGVEASKANDFIKTIDTDGDGNVSQQEHQQLLQEMEDRMSKLMAKMEGGPDGYSASQSEQVKEFEALKTMMSTVAKDTKNQTDSGNLNALLDQLETEGYSKQGVQNAMELLNKVAPPINTMA
jgi:hypothetical protein